MAYTKQTWVDRETEFPNRRKLVEVSQGVYDITRQQGTVTAEGTPITAERLNHMEDGIYAKQDAITSSNKLPYAYLSDVPTVLPNPQPLTFGSKSYDGSSAQVLVPSDIGLGTVFNLKGSKATVSDLPSSGNVIGDVWYVIAEHVGYVWLNDGTSRWEQLGLPVDLSGYAEIDGTYPDMTVGNAAEAEHADTADKADTADNLGAETSVTVSTPFVFRTSGGGADVDGDVDARAEISAIYGNTIVESGSLVNFTGTGIKTVGFNALSPDGTARLLGGNEYEIFGTYTALSYSTGETITPVSGKFTPSSDGILTVSGADGTTCVHLVWSGYRNGEYEPYWTETKALPVSTYFPDGMKSAGTVRDELTRDKAIRRCGVRTYQSGDETNPSVTTDGTNTVYALSSAVETAIDPPLDFSFRSSDYGTELLLPETGTAPMYADISYAQNLRDKLQRMPMSPSAPDTYAVCFNGVNQSYVPLSQYTAPMYDDLAVLAAIADRTYEGVDLTIKFASEIAAAPYSGDAWAWIKARITAGNFRGIHVCDWIPFTADSHSFKAQIAGINTYKGYGDLVVGNHVDFISKELWHTSHVINPVYFNNGTKFGSAAATEFPWLASDLYLWLNSKSGTVVSGDAAGGGTGMTVNYTTTGVYDKLPDALKAVIIEKRMLLGKRYSETDVLSNPNSWGWGNAGKLWLPTECEVYGQGVWGNAALDIGGSAVQYPIFSGNMNRIKNQNGSRGRWWLLVPYCGNTTHWCDVYDNGTANYNGASIPNVAAPVCFRIG